MPNNETDTRTIVTEDGITLKTGDRAFNYYDHRPGRIEKLNAYPQGNGVLWFDFRHDDGSYALLDGSRICSIELAERKGWLK